MGTQTLWRLVVVVVCYGLSVHALLQDNSTTTTTVATIPVHALLQTNILTIMEASSPTPGTTTTQSNTIDTERATQETTTDFSDCPDGFLGYEQSCYMFTSNPEPYYDAKYTCQVKYYGQLATIGSRGENDFVASLAQNEKTWIGGTRDTSASVSTYLATDEYKFVSSQHLNLEKGSFRFSVKSQRRAYLLLASSEDIEPRSPAYEIIIGAESNRGSLMRRCQECDSLVESSKSFLNKRWSRNFFVNFHEGRIQVGDMKTRELILEYVDPLPISVRYAAFRTESSVGTWKFYGAEFKWDTEEPWDFENFRIGEPSNIVYEENCLETNHIQPGLWNAHFCGEPKPSVCEVDKL